MGIAGCWTSATIIRVTNLRIMQGKSVIRWLNAYPEGADSWTYREFYALTGEAAHPHVPWEPGDYTRKTVGEVRDALEAAANKAAQELCGNGASAVVIEVSGKNIGLTSWTVTCP